MQEKAIPSKALESLMKGHSAGEIQKNSPSW